MSAHISDPSDATLVAQARKGDADAFGELYRRYVEPIYRYLNVRLLDPKDAEDLTEDVFVRSFQSLSSYRERGWPFSAYLYQVAKNVLIDHYRQKKPEISLTASPPLVDSGRSLDEHVIRAEQVGNLRRVLDQLPAKFREVIILRVILEMPTALTANWMNLSEGAVRVLLHRALVALRGRMREAYDA
jgi:RNA polymerase sigma-70 factor (ECF subfamily)